MGRTNPCPSRHALDAGLTSASGARGGPHSGASGVQGGRGHGHGRGGREATARRSDGNNCSCRVLARIEACGASKEFPEPAVDLAKEDAAKIGLPPLKCPQNAPLVLYLVELAKDAQKQVEEGANDRWLVAVRRAAAEVARTTTPVGSVQQALKVKFVGEVLAKRIKGFFTVCPPWGGAGAGPGAEMGADAATATAKAVDAPKKRGRPTKAEAAAKAAAASSSPGGSADASPPAAKKARTATAAAESDTARVQQVQGDRGFHNPKKAPKPRTAAFTFLCVMYRDLNLPSGRDWGKHDRLQQHTKQSLIDSAEASGIANNPIRGTGAHLPAFAGGPGHAAAAHAGPSQYDGWSSWRGLVNANPPLCQEWSNPKKVRLTLEGEVVARRCYRKALEMDLVFERDDDDGNENEGTGDDDNEKDHAKVVREQAPDMAHPEAKSSVFATATAPVATASLRQRECFDLCDSPKVHRKADTLPGNKENATHGNVEVFDLTASPVLPPPIATTTKTAPVAAAAHVSPPSPRAPAAKSRLATDASLPNSQQHPTRQVVAGTSNVDAPSSQLLGGLMQPENSVRVKFNFGQTHAMRPLALATSSARFSASFDVAIVLDSREQYNRHTSAGRTESIQAHANRLRARGIRTFVKTLPAGDAAWIAIPKGIVTADETRQMTLAQALSRHGGLAEDDVPLLDAVLERKSIHDLVGSIQDGRYERQKHYLTRCGLRRPMYLVEGDATWGVSATESKRVQYAAVETDLGDGIAVVRTENVNDTLRFLEVITNTLASEYDSLHIANTRQEDAGEADAEAHLALVDKAHPPNFGDFVAYVQKQQKLHQSSLGNAWLRMLCQIPGVGGDIAEAIAEEFPTPMSLLAHYNALVYGSAAPAGQTDPQRRVHASLCLARLKIGRSGTRTIGAAASQKVYDNIWASA